MARRALYSLEMEIYEEIRADRELGARRLVAEYRPRLEAAARMLCQDAHEAEDLVFRAFERAIERIDDFRPTGSFYYWVYTILLNFHRMDLRRRAARKETVVPNDELPEVEDKSPNPLEEFAFRGSAEAVRTAVRKLPERYREVVVLRYFEDLSTPEIAKIVGIPEGTVRSRLHYAKDALYDMLCDTELSPDFTERLIKATRPRNAWLFRHSWIACFVAILSLATLAAGTVAVLRSGEEVPAAASAAAVVDAGGGLRRTVGGGSTFSPEADDVDRSIERGLKFLASKQLPSGAFPGQYGDSAAIPALVGMAFLSKGHLPGSEPYGAVVENCVDYVLDCADMGPQARFRGYMGQQGGGRMYAHSIATLFLSEASGMVDPARQARIDAVLPHAVKVIIDAQGQRKSHPSHLGGWRYTPDASDSDLSCSGWALMALRSARLNGAALPDDAIEKAVLYIKRSQRQSDGAFSYQGNSGNFGETLSGAAILCIELCGHHLDPEALKGAQFVRRTFRRALAGGNNAFYGLYYTAQGLFQLGGEAWAEFEPWMYETYFKKQQPDGSWNGEIGQVYCTSMAVLAFTVPYRMLPIYQRDETVDADETGEENRK